MADEKISQLTADTAPTIDDLMVTVTDPAGTPANRKVTLENLFKVISGLTADTAPTTDDLVVTLGDPGGTPVVRKVTLDDLFDVLATRYLHYQDQKAQNTPGGTFTSGAWQTRDLNTEVSDAGGHGSLASNQITLAAGTYIIYATAPAMTVGAHQARLQNVTAGTTILPGTSVFTTTAVGVISPSIVGGVFTIAAAQALEIQHQCQTTAATEGFGKQANFTTEVYTDVHLLKVG